MDTYLGFENYRELIEYVNGIDNQDMSKDIVLFMNENVDEYEKIYLSSFIASVPGYNVELLKYPLESYDPPKIDDLDDVTKLHIFLYPKVHGETFHILLCIYNNMLNIEGKYMFTSVVNQYIKVQNECGIEDVSLIEDVDTRDIICQGDTDSEITEDLYKYCDDDIISKDKYLLKMIKESEDAIVFNRNKCPLRNTLRNEDGLTGFGVQLFILFVAILLHTGVILGRYFQCSYGI